MAHWQFCNILRVDDGAHCLWQFDTRGGGLALNREHRAAQGESLPAGMIAKTWRSLWQPKLNVAWLPPESVFLRVIELPKSSFEETLAMAELQLEKLSPMPVAQIVWTIHILSRRSDPPRESGTETEAKADAATAGAEMQTVIVVIAARHAVEEFLGKLEGQGYLADRLEAPMLDELEAATRATEDGLSRQSEAVVDTWIYPATLAGQSAAIVAWWRGGALRSLSFIVLPPTGDRAKSLKDQLAQLTWAGELEGWLTGPPQWHLIADAAIGAEWENALRTGLDEPVHVAPPLPLEELAARTARRSVEIPQGGTHAALLPQEFSARYRQQFFDRLWLRGLMAAGVLYAVVVAVYFCDREVLAYQTHAVEGQVANLSGSYTNALQLKARCDVLRERQDLKYAALDCWKIVAEQLPEGISLQRLSFSDGQKLSLSGTIAPGQINGLFDFNSSLQKASLNNQPVFKTEGGEPLVYHQNGNTVTWNFSLALQRGDNAP